MGIVRPYARLLNLSSREEGIALLRKIEWIGRISHRSEDAQTEDSWDRFITNVVLVHGDWSIVEHASATVDMVVDRGITHEWVRHRLFSFTQESTRFVNYEKKMPPSFIMPQLETKQSAEDSLSLNEKRALCEQWWEQAITRAELAYKDLICLGLAPQIARSVFPNALASRIVTTGNLRVWRHVFCMRSCKEAHPQMRQVILPLLEEFKSKIPLLYDDISPNARQVDNMRLPQ
jgi:thymidylate synthase (FAD)